MQEFVETFEFLVRNCRKELTEEQEKHVSLIREKLQRVDYRDQLIAKESLALAYLRDICEFNLSAEQERRAAGKIKLSLQECFRRAEEIRQPNKESCNLWSHLIRNGMVCC